jgi:hypothetical protein
MLKTTFCKDYFSAALRQLQLTAYDAVPGGHLVENLFQEEP